MTGQVARKTGGEAGFHDLAQGAIMGALIGDALSLGCHWYYDLDALKTDNGWVSDYTPSKPDRTDRFAHIAKFRYDAGLRAGDVSQTGQVLILLLESVAERGTYAEDDFTSRLDIFLETLDGTSMSGRFSDWAVRDIYTLRKSGIDWSKVGSAADTAEAAIRATVLAALFYSDPERLARECYRNILLTHKDPYIAEQSLSFALTVAAFINGTPLPEIKNHMGSLAQNEAIREFVPSYDCLAQVADGAVAVKSPITIEPASLIAQLHGLHCTMGTMLPSAYYFIHRYPDNFEMAVLSAVNSGGNNMARAALTGALSGAMVGLKGIPERFITGLEDHQRLLHMAEKVAAASSLTVV